ncbi:MAG: hypothetical protein LQ342_001179 [Letrouitia transgressa]|nr:MAG: hypothetical protein LQ342_001179 [Letrouitia transgressa]
MEAGSSDAEESLTQALDAQFYDMIENIEPHKSSDLGQTEPEELAEAVELVSKGEHVADHVFQIKVILPHQPYEIQIMVSTQEQVQDLRQSIVEQPAAFQYSCFHLEHHGQKINDYSDLSDVKNLAAGSELRLIEDPYTEKEARMHVVRVRELIGAAGNRVDTLHGISAGVSLHENVLPWCGTEQHNSDRRKPAASKTLEGVNALADFQPQGPPFLQTLIPHAQELLPKTIKALTVSPWNPPPPYFRQRGHLIYLQVTTNEGEQYQITSHVSGFFVNKSSNNRFDPMPRPSPKNAMAHSLFALIQNLSPSFESSFNKLLEANNKRDPLGNFHLTSAIPSYPWLVPAVSSGGATHQPDMTRTQETYLLAGVENTETLRDWNEEIQTTRELPRETVQDRVFRERMTAKIMAEFNEAAARGAVLVARGEVAALNPTESKDAQIFVYNNIFYSFGADGVGTFTSEGGDEAARVAVGKDVMGVKAVNQLDIAGLATPGTIIVDYLGKRLVAQSIVPGIFKQREPDEPQVDYGGVEGRDVVAENSVFIPTFSQVSKTLKVKKHPVWDKEGNRHVLEASVETKGLLGTDGRKYMLDLYRLTPLDVSWLDAYWTDNEVHGSKPKERNYPHRMAVLRPELVEAYWRLKMGEYVKEEVEKRKTSRKHESNTGKDDPVHSTQNNGHGSGLANGVSNMDNKKPESHKEQDRIDISTFSWSLNPDVFCGQQPRTEQEKEDWTIDEQEVRTVADYLHQKVIPELLNDLEEGEVGFPMDGQSLSRLLHKRGINIRYIGKIASLAESDNRRLQALRALAVQEMIARAFKHVAHRHLKKLPMPMTGACIAHLLNCLLGTGVNKSPVADVDEDLKFLYNEGDMSFANTTPDSLRSDIEEQVQIRYRYILGSWLSDIKHIQLLREISLKIGLQMIAKDYNFSLDSVASSDQSIHLTNGNSIHSAINSHPVNGLISKKKKRNAGNSSPTSMNGCNTTDATMTFIPNDVANIVPIIKDACSKSILAEEALEAGRISMVQNQKELGQELLLESLSLHEQIYGILHPEVARVYHQLAMLYHNLDEKDTAVELAHKAVVISERTLGVDSNETILSYLNLSLFEHANGNTSVALACMRHALELWKIIFGSYHPDCITTFNNAAVMLQHLKYFHESRLWFELSIAMSEDMCGKDSVNTATLAFQLAQALALDQDHKGAVRRMRDAYSTFLNKFGAEHQNTKEAEGWLEQLTQNAVSIAKHAKDVQARRIRRVLFTPRVTLGTQPQAPVGQTSATRPSNSNTHTNSDFDSRSIDELMKYIEGGEASKKTPTKKRKNPRNRRA